MVYFMMVWVQELGGFYIGTHMLEFMCELYSGILLPGW